MEDLSCHKTIILLPTLSIVIHPQQVTSHLIKHIKQQCQCIRERTMTVHITFLSIYILQVLGMDILNFYLEVILINIITIPHLEYIVIQDFVKIKNTK